MGRRPLAPTVLFLALLTACAAGPSSESAPTPSGRNVLTREEFAVGDFVNAYEAIKTLRPNWLRPRGIDSFQSPTEVQVYLDHSRLGGVEMLRSIELMGVAYIQHFDGIEATARWGLNHGQGAILVSMRPGGDSARGWGGERSRGRS